tara:strand:- start:2127 stop:2615 length:489 start_codon:yes stop_codon:yes gene_type:complete
MQTLQRLENKIYTLKALDFKVRDWKKNKKKIVFTNGCFDILHQGHIDILAKSADLGNKLIVAINSDDSIKKLKGDERPITKQKTRSMLLASFSYIDAVIIFEEDTPLKLIQKLMPDVLAKGEDYQKHDIVGYKEIIENGGDVITIPLTQGFSTTNIVNQLKR